MNKPKKEIIEANNCNLDSIHMRLEIEYMCLCQEGMSGLAQKVYYELKEVEEEISNRILLGEWDEKYMWDDNTDDSISVSSN